MYYFNKKKDSNGYDKLNSCKSEYQGKLLSIFLSNLLKLNLVFFLVRNFTDIILMIFYVYDNDSGHFAFIKAIFVQTVMVVEFLTFAIFFYKYINKNKENSNQRIIKFWFIAYINLSACWIIMIDIIQNITFKNRMDANEYRIFSRALPYLYIIISSIIVAVVIYRTALHIHSRLFQISAMIYPIITITIMWLLRSQSIIFTHISSFRMNRMDIVTSLYNVQYIIWLFALSGKVRNDCFQQNTISNNN